VQQFGTVAEVMQSVKRVDAAAPVVVAMPRHAAAG
jgi:hypothetical protein